MIAHYSIRDISRGMRTRARTKDLDQIHEDIAAPQKLLNLEPDVDLPGMGQFYCLPVIKSTSLVIAVWQAFHCRRSLSTPRKGKSTQKKVRRQ